MSGDWRLSEGKVKPVPVSLVVGGSIALFLQRGNRMCVSGETRTRTQLRSWVPRTSVPSQAQVVPPALIESGRGWSGLWPGTLFFSSLFPFPFAIDFPRSVRLLRAGGTPLTLFWLVREMGSGALSGRWKALERLNQGRGQAVGG